MISLTGTQHADPAAFAADASLADRSSELPRAYRIARRTAWNLAKRMVATTGSGLNWLLGSQGVQRFGILMYHRVANPVPGVAQSTWNVRPALFRQQLVGLVNRGYQAWPLRQLIQDCGHGVLPPSKVFAVTFDDVHESVYRHAWPVLKEFKIPATAFLSTAYLDSQEAFPFDDWTAAGTALAPGDTWRPLTTAQCREMAADGLVELGAHTHTHQDFCSRPDEFENDLARNLEELRSRFGVRDASFAFPFGRATPRMMSAVRDAGLTCALMDSGQLVAPGDAPFGWGRIHVESWDTAATLAARLNGWYGSVVKLQRRLASRRRPECIY